MTIIIFLIVLVALIVVHEFGHFVVAKWTGMRVDEFGLGYPPRALVFSKKGETEYTLNWLPFGGFVKIYGEDSEAQGVRSFINRPKLAQAAVLLAGVTMNVLFAYVLLTGALIVGTPRALSADEAPLARDAQLDIANVLPNTPAANAGLMPGDEIFKADTVRSNWTTGPSQAIHPETFTNFIAMSGGDPVTLTLLRNNKTVHITAKPQQGLVQSDPSRYALGIEVAPVGTVPESVGQAIIDGAKLTYGATLLTAAGLTHFIATAFALHADLSQVAGPVGIVGAVGTAAKTGFGDLLSLTALISINLAIINLIPVPALDGGRLLFVIVEAITRRRIPVKFAQSVNAVGFALLILLMVVVTAHDIFKIAT